MEDTIIMDSSRDPANLQFELFLLLVDMHLSQINLTYIRKSFFGAQYFSKVYISSHRAETSLQYSYVYLSVNWPISSWRYFLVFSRWNCVNC
jgi:hypothetical protein